MLNKFVRSSGQKAERKKKYFAWEKSRNGLPYLAMGLTARDASINPNEITPDLRTAGRERINCPRGLIRLPSSSLDLFHFRFLVLW